MNFGRLLVGLVFQFEDEFDRHLCTILSLGLCGRHASRRRGDRRFAGGSSVGAVVGHCRLLLRSAYGEFVLENLAQLTSLNYRTDLTDRRILVEGM